MKKKKLMTKILLFVGIPVLVIYSIAALLITQTIKQSVSQLTANDLTSESKAASYQIENYFSKYTSIVQQLKLNASMQNFVKDASNAS